MNDINVKNTQREREKYILISENKWLTNVVFLVQEWYTFSEWHHFYQTRDEFLHQPIEFNADENILRIRLFAL